MRTERGGLMLIHQNFMYYHKDILREGKHVWRCTEYYNPDIQCSATICTSGRSHNSHITNQENDDHNHLPDQAKLEKKKIENKIKRTALRKEDPAHQLVDEVIHNATDVVKEALPSTKALCRLATRQRQNS